MDLRTVWECLQKGVPYDRRVNRKFISQVNLGLVGCIQCFKYFVDFHVFSCLRLKESFELHLVLGSQRASDLLQVLAVIRNLRRLHLNC